MPVQHPVAPVRNEATVRAGVTLFALVLLAVIANVLFLVEPFYANGVHRLTSEQIYNGEGSSGAGWIERQPAGSAVPLQLGLVFALLGAPLLLVWVAVRATWLLVWTHKANAWRAQAAPVIFIALVGGLAVAALLWWISPEARDIRTWFLD